MLFNARAHSFITVKHTLVVEALFTRKEGYPSKRVTLALAYFFFFHMTCLQGRWGYVSARVTLPECKGYPNKRVTAYLPCKRSARDNSPTQVNFLL